MSKRMNYTQAIDEAHGLWGKKAFAQVNRSPFLCMVGEVTVTKGEPVYFVFGEGNSWEEAFENAKTRNLN